MTVAIQSDYRHMPLARRHPCRLDVQIECTRAKRLEEAPVLPTLQAGAEEVRVAFFQARLGGGEFAVIPLFSGRGDAGQAQEIGGMRPN